MPLVVASSCPPIRISCPRLTVSLWTQHSPEVLQNADSERGSPMLRHCGSVQGGKIDNMMGPPLPESAMRHPDGKHGL